MKSLSPTSGSYRLICINDVYSFDQTSGHGGWPAACTVINRLRRECNDNCLVTVNGDFLGGSLLAEHFKGKIIVDILNYLKVDATVLGNHEFDFSTETLIERIGESKFTWFGANIVHDGAMIKGTTDGAIITTPGGLKLGLFGVCTPATANISYPCNTTEFRDPLEASQQVIARLRSEGDIDLIVGITHLGRSADIEIAETITDVDIILGGHDHDPFCQYKDHTLIMKCGQNAYWVGTIDINWQRADDGRVQYFTSWSMISTSGIQQDPTCLAIIGHYQDEFERQNESANLDEVILRITGTQLDTRTTVLRVGTASSGNLVADCLFAFFSAQGAAPDLALINAGFIRGDRLYDEQGVNMTRRLLLEEMPFPAKACCIELTGATLKASIEQHLQDFPHPSGAFPHFSAGVQIEFNRELPIGARITSFTINKHEIVPGRKYRMATSLFIAGGGDNCPAYSSSIVLPELPSRKIPDIVRWVLERRRDQKSSMELNVEHRVNEVSF